ncbi:MAG: hypothetical protein MJ244_06595, partial [Clostridia bacterium]|nr:hypothetical protein [Clostridia bacterium]
MKKITKRIMAFMLSLVMVFGCIPSFINEASAATEHTITIKNVVEGANLSDAVFEYDGGNFSGLITPLDTTFESDKVYQFKVGPNRVNGTSYGDTIKVEI